MEEFHVAVTVILLLNLMILIFVWNRQSKCTSKQADGYPGYGKCIGPGPKMGLQDPCCDPSNDLYNNPDKKDCDYDSWGFEYKGSCVGYGRTRSDCVNNCNGDSECVKKCPINYGAWVPDSCSNKINR